MRHCPHCGKSIFPRKFNAKVEIAKKLKILRNLLDATPANKRGKAFRKVDKFLKEQL